MVKDGCNTMLYGIDYSGKSRIIDRVLIKNLIKPPPEVHKDFFEVIRITFWYETNCKRGIEMMMRIKETRDD